MGPATHVPECSFYLSLCYFTFLSHESQCPPFSTDIFFGLLDMSSFFFIESQPISIATPNAATAMNFVILESPSPLATRTATARRPHG